MNLLQIIVKTIITVINLLLAIAAVFNVENSEAHKRTIAIFTLANIIGVWI